MDSNTQAAPEFPQGTPQPQTDTLTPAQPQAAPPQEDFASDPEFMASLGDAIDEMRLNQSGHASDEIRPTMRKVSHYIPHVLPDPSGGWAAMFSPKDYHTNIPVYEGETDDAARGRKDWEDQQPTAYMLSRTASQATFGASSYAWTRGFEQEYQQQHPDDVKPIEMAAMANNLVGWKLTPVGKVLDTVFTSTTQAITRKVMQSQIAGRLIEEKLAVPVRAWMSAAFGKTTQEAYGAAANSSVRLEQALSSAGGHALKDGSLYVPSGASNAAMGEVKQAATALRQEMGMSATPIKVVRKDTALTGLGHLVTAATHVGGGAAAGSTAGAIDSLTQYMLGDAKDKEQAFYEAPERVARGAKWGGAAGVPFALGSSIAEVVAGKGRSIPAGAAPGNYDLPRIRAGQRLLTTGAEPTSAASGPASWNISTMGPVPTGWKGKVISK